MSNGKKYEATETGYKEVDKPASTENVTIEKKEERLEKLENKKTKKGGSSKKAKAKAKADNVTKKKLSLETNMDIPYPHLGGHTVSQLAGMEDHKRKAILGEKDDEFKKNYL